MYYRIVENIGGSKIWQIWRNSDCLLNCDTKMNAGRNNYVGCNC